MNGQKSSIFRIGIFSGMALLLAIVGIMQYKWATELSTATEVRLGSNLQSLMTSWNRDFYDEMSAICIALQVGPDSGAHDAWNDYLQRYAEWTRERSNNEAAENTGTSPDLVREIYEWQTSVAGKPELLRLNPKAKALESISTPQKLEPLLWRLQVNSSDVRAAMRAWEFREEFESQRPEVSSSQKVALRSNALAGWQFDGSVPALVHPVVHHADPFNSQTPVDRVSVDWLVVVLDMKAIQDRLLPELANRHFGGPDGLEYKLALVDMGNAHPALYSSDANLRIDKGSDFDSVMYIFGSPSDSATRIAPQVVKHTKNQQEQDWRSFAAPVWFPVIQYAAQSSSWALMIQHRTGPVGKIAKSVWYWDLTIGGIVLVLLAANMGLVLFSSHRAQKLAKLQLHFVAAVSHELLSPLSAMYCTGQNARDGLVQTQSDMIAHGSIITSQSRQLIDLVKQNLLFAATESGTKRYTMNPLQVSEILRSVRKDVAWVAEESGATVEYKVQPELPDVLGDLAALTHCLQNLVVNAIKYSGKNGWIGISASLEDAKGGIREVQIRVTDHGPGIDSSDLRHIFEPFYRSPKVVDAQIHGTGLGLTVAERIAKAMGGRLSVTSEVGVGSVFTLHLPLRKLNAEMSATLQEVVQGQP